jgi:AcrR family transcriptional regulator
MARGRSASYEDQRAMILERAAGLFARQGYPSTSMNQVAEACNLSKATLYHYYRDKYSLLVGIAEGHVSHLAALVEDKQALALAGEKRLRHFIHRIVEAYAGAQDAHRVLTEDVKFLKPDDRERILDSERLVVTAFSRAVTEMRPELAAAHLEKPLTMLLFGMVNWMFTWIRPDGQLDHAAMGPIVADLFIGGIAKVEASRSGTANRKVSGKATASRAELNAPQPPRPRRLPRS